MCVRVTCKYAGTWNSYLYVHWILDFKQLLLLLLSTEHVGDVLYAVCDVCIHGVVVC